MKRRDRAWLVVSAVEHQAQKQGGVDSEGVHAVIAQYATDEADKAELTKDVVDILHSKGYDVEPPDMELRHVLLGIALAALSLLVVVVAYLMI